MTRSRRRMSWTRSLRGRLTLYLVAGAALLATVMVLTMGSFAQRLAAENRDNVLLASAVSILDATGVGDGTIVADIPYAALSMLGSVSEDRVFYRVDVDGAFLTGYPDLPVSAASPTSPGFASATFRGAELRLVSAKRIFSPAGRRQTVTVTVAQTRDGLSAQLGELYRLTALQGFGFFLLAALLGVWAAGVTTRPLTRLAAAVARRGPGDLRPFQADVPGEMAPLVAALNGFTERLSRALDRSEEFITEAAHRVRTPLATVRTQAEVTLRRVERDENRRSLRQMIRAVDECSRAAGQLLDRAMVALRADALHREPTDLRQALKEIVERMRPMGELRDIALRTEFVSATLDVDPVLIQNAMSNIIDNAIKYSPPESEVLVRMRLEPEALRLEVFDAGDGFPPEALSEATARFFRGANAEGVIGSGLGLTIAGEVATAHGGRLEFRNNGGGGACVALVLPL